MNQNSVSKQRKKFVWGQLTLFLCGLRLTIIESSSKELIGLTGIIENETSQLLAVNTGKKTIWVQKRNNTFEIELSDKTIVVVRGDTLLGLPENRIKKKAYNW
ncbi:MAG: ribonuclease P protein component 1 [Candidatus Heimdallarchaeaceae archaeon]